MKKLVKALQEIAKALRGIEEELVKLNDLTEHMETHVSIIADDSERHSEVG